MCMQVDGVFYPETPVNKIGANAGCKGMISNESVGIFIWV